MINTDETRSEYNNNNPFEEYCPPTMLDFNKEVQQIAENFQKCTIKEIQFDSNEINKVMTNVIQVVNGQHKIFRKFVVDSLQLCKKLAYFPIFISFFVDSYKDDQYSKETILVCILEQSKTNHRIIKELISTIAKNEEVNRPENTENIENNEIMNELTTFLKVIENNGHIGIKEKLTGINNNFLCEFVKYIKKVNKKASSGILFNINGRKLEKQLDELANYCDYLRSVTVEIGRIETFWVTQIERFDSLITEITKWFDGNKSMKQLDKVANRIGKNWKDVRKEFDIYDKTMGTVVVSEVTDTYLIKTHLLSGWSSGHLSSQKLVHR